MLLYGRTAAAAFVVLVLTGTELARGTIGAVALLVTGLLLSDRRLPGALSAFLLGVVALNVGKLMLQPRALAPIFNLALAALFFAGMWKMGTVLGRLMRRANYAMVVVLLLAALGASLVGGFGSHGFFIIRLTFAACAFGVAAVPAHQRPIAALVFTGIYSVLQLLMGSRASILFAGSVFIVLPLLTRVVRTRLRVAGAAILLALVSVATFVMFGVSRVRDQLFIDGSFFNGVYLADRDVLARDALDALGRSVDTMLFGIRPGGFSSVGVRNTVYPFPHNILFELAFLVGIPVAALVIALALPTIAGALRTVTIDRTTSDRGRFVGSAGLLFIIGLSMFNGSLTDYRFVALWLGVLAGSGGGSIEGERALLTHSERSLT